MERSEISRHEVAVYQALQTHRAEWVTSGTVAAEAGVAPRTARAHVLKLVRLGLLDQAEVFPGHRYRLSEHAGSRNRSYLDRLERAAEVIGLTAPSPGTREGLKPDVLAELEMQFGNFLARAYPEMVERNTHLGSIELLHIAEQILRDEIAPISTTTKGAS